MPGVVDDGISDDDDGSLVELVEWWWWWPGMVTEETGTGVISIPRARMMMRMKAAGVKLELRVEGDDVSVTIGMC